MELDFKLILSLIDIGVDVMHPHLSLVMCCQGLLARDWTVRFSHIFQEGNRVVDALANFVFSLDIGLHILDTAPACTRHILFEDLQGVSLPHMTRL